MVAVVIPYYKKRFFRETLSSLASQTDKRFRVYIGDDCSPESPMDVINDYSDRLELTYKRFPCNIGAESLVMQWQRCIGLTQDEKWITILGDDDTYSENLIGEFYNQLSFFDGKTNLIRFATKIVFQDTGTISPTFYPMRREKSADSFYRREFEEVGRNSLSEYFFSREVYQKYNFRDFPLGWYSDIAAWLDFSEGKEIYSVREQVVSVGFSRDSISGNIRQSLKKTIAAQLFYKLLSILCFIR